MEQGSKSSIVAMTNGDVYYVERSVAKKLIECVSVDTTPPPFYLVTDQKSGAIVAISTGQISSIVNKDTHRG